MAFSVFSETLLNAALWLATASLLATLTLSGTVVGLRIRKRLQQKREQTFVDAWLPLLMQSVVGATTTKFPPLPSRDHFLILKHWCHLHESIRGQVAEQLNQAARQLDLHHVALDFLHHGNSTRQLLAILAIGHLREVAAWDKLAELSRSPNSTLSVYAGRALVQIDPVRAAPHILPALLHRQDWNIVRAANLLQRSHGALGDLLMRELPAMDEDKPALTRALRLAEALYLPIPPATQLHLLSDDRPIEIQLAALRIASSPQAISEIRAKRHHPDWRVRLQVARALGRLGTAADIEYLTLLLQDAQWWVRYRAARALFDLLDMPAIKELRHRLQDRYACDILDQVLAEHPHPSRSI